MTTMLEPSTSSMPSCLRSTAGAPVPLVGVALSGEVYGAQARVVIRQKYRNAEAQPIEAVYTFPVPSDGVLAGFAMECEGRRLEGEVKEREEAFQAYDDALTKGHGAALLEEERKNVFTANVGNLLPGEETVIEVVYVQRLAGDEGALRLMIPTLVAPRYIPGAPQGDRTGHGAQNPTDRVPDADRISPQIGHVDYGLELDLLFDLGRDVTIESPSHGITVAKGENDRRRVRLKSPNVALDRDLVLLAVGAPGVAAGAVADRQDGAEGTFALTIVPDLFEGKRRGGTSDVVFVVDTSGSMEGESIEQARTAMRLCLRHLSEGDRFDIISFHTSHTAHQGTLVPFTQRTLADADRFIAALYASGGTEMLEPLIAAVDELGDAKRERIVVLLTDGQVGNEAEIVERVVGKAGRVRFYTFGIGTNVSDLLVRDLARRTKGAAEFIFPGERLDEKVTAQFARATATRVDDVALTLVGVDGGELAPAELPPLVDGEPWVVYGRYDAASVGHAEVRGTLRGEPFYLKVPVELPALADRPGLAALWAGTRIRDLEEGEAKLDGRRREAQKKRIVALSVEHKIASKHASFVVVEKRTGDRRAKGMPETRAVPVNGPAGWAMTGDAKKGEGGAFQAMKSTLAGGTATRMAMMPSPARSFGAPPPPPAMAAPRGGAPLPQAPPGFGAIRPSAPAPMAPAAMAPPSPPPPPAPGSPARAKKAEASAGIGGLFERAASKMKDMFGGGGRADADDEAYADQTLAAPAAEAMADYGPPRSPAPAEAAPSATAPDLAALFERQLASGLWDGADDAARLLATARVFVTCHAQGVDATHAVYGTQLKKAIEAVLALVGALASKAEAACAAALAAASLVATGRRQRAEIADAVKQSASAKVREVEAALASPDAALAKAKALGA
jgi:Ca-activated chloride channel family protein